MDQSGNLIIVIVVLFFSIVFAIFNTQSQKNTIRQALRKKGAKDIDIFWLPLDFDKSNNTYVVDYKDENGVIHKRTCKIHVLGSSIYWEDEDA